MESSDSQQNVTAPDQFQVRVGNRSAYYAELVRKSEQMQEVLKASQRARFWFAVRVALACVLSTGVGLFMMAWALHTTDIENAQLAWTAGPIVGNGLTIIIIAWAAARWERDEW
jgi:hypothetical protein